MSQGDTLIHNINVLSKIKRKNYFFKKKLLRYSLNGLKDEDPNDLRNKYLSKSPNLTLCCLQEILFTDTNILCRQKKTFHANENQ